MRLFLRYLKEKRTTLFLYMVTILFFVSVGSLYHIENMEKLLYAALLTATVWLIVLAGEGFRYVKKSRQLEMAYHHFTHSGELLFPKDRSGQLQEAEGEIEAAQDYDMAQQAFLALVCEAQEKEKQQWEEKNAERGDYYLMWTHQIKTPILAIKLLLDKPGLQEKDLFLLREKLLHVEQYAVIVLTFQRLESISADLVLQSYSLCDLLKQAVRKYSLSFINKSLHLDLPDMERQILTDEKWFVFCLEQLLSNSIKYTVKGGISFRSREEGERVYLVMEDTGIGIRPEDLPRIFEKGFTGYNGRLEKKSTGIGLYLCRQIFTHLNVTVRAESSQGQGTAITLGIPSARRSPKS